MSSTVLFKGTFLLASPAVALYTSPVNGKGTWVDVATALNDNVAAQTMDFYVVKAADSPIAENRVIKNKSIGIAATDLMPEVRGKFLMPGDSLHGSCATGSAITVSANGRELT